MEIWVLNIILMFYGTLFIMNYDDELHLMIQQENMYRSLPVSIHVDLYVRNLSVYLSFFFLSHLFVSGFQCGLVQRY